MYPSVKFKTWFDTSDTQHQLKKWIHNGDGDAVYLLLHFQKWHFWKCKNQNFLFKASGWSQKSIPRRSENNTFESVKIESVRVDRLSQWCFTQILISLVVPSDCKNLPRCGTFFAKISTVWIFSREKGMKDEWQGLDTVQ